MLIVFGGLPGTGKTTLAQDVAGRFGAAYLRIDAIEVALLRAGIAQSEPTGLAAYIVAHAVAEGSLAAGATVVIDAVNPVEEAREGWRELAHRMKKPLRVVEVVCDDELEHRRRVESRTADLEGQSLPTWQEVQDREYESWNEPRLTVDTTTAPPAECIAQILEFIVS